MTKINYDRYYWQNDLVRLRAMKEDDWQLAYENMYDSHARRMLQYQMDLPPTETAIRKGNEQWLDFNPETGRLMFGIETLDGTTVGAINLNSIDEKNGVFSIGMQVGREFRGKGYGTAAMRILLNYAFFERRLNRYEGSILDGNIGSETMLKKLGCVQEGVQRQCVYTDGKYMDIKLFGLLKAEFIQNEKNSISNNKTT